MGGVSYGHDLHGALYSGHARRGAEAADKLLRAGAGLMDPMGVRNREPERERSMAFGRALDVLIEVAELRGMPADEIIARLESDVED